MQSIQKHPKKIDISIHEMHEGKLKNGKIEKKVTNPYQGRAIVLSEEEEKGDKAPKKISSKKKS